MTRLAASQKPVSESAQSGGVAVAPQRALGAASRKRKNAPSAARGVTALDPVRSKALLEAFRQSAITPDLPPLSDDQQLVVQVVLGPKGALTCSTQVTSGDLAQSLLDAAMLTGDAATAELRRTLTQRTVDNVLSGTRWLAPVELNAVRDTQTTNPSNTVKRWIEAQRLFAIERGGVRLIPAYALDELGEPIPILQEVLKVLAGRSPFRIAAWFESPTNYLDGQRPRDLLATDGLAVLQAAQQSQSGAVHG
ncbi:MAG TPA: hypothetical protein PLW24_09220 [Burkholderiaceae bacterium]|nr:hypothetical protein [Burkholderiaceae bacterium]HNG79636.1 hypothetical protein [Burkholderiaceae bacterium]